jgi:hypothetical protein
MQASAKWHQRRVAIPIPETKASTSIAPRQAGSSAMEAIMPANKANLARFQVGNDRNVFRVRYFSAMFCGESIVDGVIVNLLGKILAQAPNGTGVSVNGLGLQTFQLQVLEMGLVLPVEVAGQGVRPLRQTSCRLENLIFRFRGNDESGLFQGIC